jgi:myosin heavy subunit
MEVEREKVSGQSALRTAVLGLVAALGIIALGSACGDDHARTYKPNATDASVKKEAKEALEATKDYAAKKRDEFWVDMQKELDALDKRLDELRDRALNANAEIRKEIDDSRVDIEKKRTTARVKLEELKSAAANRWEDLQKAIRSAVDDTRSALDKAWAKLK